MIWARKPVVHMSKAKVVEIMQSRCISKHTTVGLEGGEFLLHPEAMEILKWFSENHPNFELLSNGLQSHRVIEAVKKYPPKRLYISLDGGKDTYSYMRGVDGFDKVIAIIEACKDIVPVSVMFTLSPYNTFDDLNYVVAIAEKQAVDIRIGIYSDIDFFNTVDKAHDTGIGEIIAGKNEANAVDFKAQIPESVKKTSENYDFLLLYDEWKNKRLKLNCYSIFDSLVIHPDGNVPICQNLDVSLGNVNENSLDQIYNGMVSQKRQKQYARSCNQCWVNFHRKYDIVLLRSLESLMPKSFIELFYGKYHWTNDRKMTYKRFLQKY
jgi:MoaA/NifB/PqqE/SkfB family radical SAM enzyme